MSLLPTNHGSMLLLVRRGQVAKTEQTCQKRPSFLCSPLAVVVIFAITSCIFVIYDVMVRRRQVKMMQRLVREDKIVADLFPARYRALLYDEGSDTQDNDARSLASKRHLELFSEDLENPDTFKSAPLADLYLNTTIMFADIGKFNLLFGSFQRMPLYETQW